ncbi:hypothetical protein RJ639_034533 [Escallonia herrerae]|uniref:Uncharacterized protein n=1 Tax=Escallonia herrerae TaxID=1293975 RepID=A0AA88WUY6_9ASTE|nr:hypothetical protein RJ639_034533 [Escallonia herrerae]
MSTATLLCSSTATSPLLPPTKPFNSKSPLSLRRSRVVPLSTNQRHCTQLVLTSKDKAVKVRGLPACDATRRNSAGDTTTGGASSPEHGGSDNVRRGLQLVLWLAEGIYILWLFLLPYAPGDPVWAISSDTVNSLVGLSLNFFFLLPLMNSGYVIVSLIGLFYDAAFLIPYMAIRLNEADAQYPPRKISRLGSVMTNGSPIVGVVGGAVCIISTLWALFGRADGQIATTLLPQIDDIGGLVEEYDHLLLGYPWLALEGGLELFPCIFPRPKVVWTQRNGAVTWYHLIEAKTDVLLHPNELQH